MNGDSGQHRRPRRFKHWLMDRNSRELNAVTGMRIAEAIMHTTPPPAEGLCPDPSCSGCTRRQLAIEYAALARKIGGAT